MRNTKSSRRQKGWLRGEIPQTVRLPRKLGVKSIRRSPDAVLSLSVNLNMRRGWSYMTQTSKSGADY